MKKFAIHFLVIILIISQNANVVFAQQPPVIKKIKKEIVKHGHKRTDNYYWMREAKDSIMLMHILAENEYTKNILKTTEELQKKLYNEITSRIQETDLTVSYKENGYYYFTRYEEGKEYPVYTRKKDTEMAKEEIIIDVNELSSNYNYYQIQGITISPDNNFVVFGYDTIGNNIYTLKLKNISTGKFLEEEISNTTGNAVWANDNKTIFYSINDKLARPFKIKKHMIDESPQKDKLVYHEKNPRFDVNVYKSKSGKYIIISSFSPLSTEHRVLNANKPLGDFQIIHPREKDLEYSIYHYDDKFFILTNYKAKNFRLMETSENLTEKKNWKEVIPHKTDSRIFNIEVFKNHLAIEELNYGTKQIKIFNLQNSTNHYLKFNEEVYSASLSQNPDFDNEWLRYNYSSLTTPNITFEYNMRSGETKILKQREISGGFDPDAYESKKLYAIAKDGAKIPISLVYKKGLTLNGENPLLLNGYGAYGGYDDPKFSVSRLSLLDRGFVFAIAHVRGGEELGREWYENGRLMNKKNTFTDFISCAEHLIKEGYTKPDKLFAQGQSAGGLLIGAVVNMRADLFKGVIANVPFVDVLTSMLDESLPLTIFEYDEWGNPNKKEYYDYMLSYSPYDNIDPKKYPAIFVTTGISDQYWEAAKWVVKLREFNTGDNHIILWTNMHAGHDGASGRFEAIKETVMEYAFLLQLLEIN